MTSHNASATTSYVTHTDWTVYNGNETIYLSPKLHGSVNPHTFYTMPATAKNNITISGPVTDSGPHKK